MNTMGADRCLNKEVASGVGTRHIFGKSNKRPNGVVGAVGVGEST